MVAAASFWTASELGSIGLAALEGLEGLAYYVSRLMVGMDVLLRIGTAAASSLGLL